jgi:hypothetical protein
LRVRSAGLGIRRSTTAPISRCKQRRSLTGSRRVTFIDAIERLALIAMLAFMEINGSDVEASDPERARPGGHLRVRFVPGPSTGASHP